MLNIVCKFQEFVEANEGAINDASQLDKLVKTIRETDKRENLKCVFTQMLKKSNNKILNM